MAFQQLNSTKMIRHTRKTEYKKIPKKNLDIIYKQKLDKLKKKIDFSKKWILGLDLSRSQPGISMYNVHTNEYIISSKKIYNKDFSAVIEVREYLKNLLTRFKIYDNILFILLEDYAYNSKWGRELAGELNGIIKEYLYSNNIICFTVAPQQLKSFIGKKGKTEIIDEVKNKYNKSVCNSDQADSFVLANIGEMIYKAINNESINKHQFEIIKKIIISKTGYALEYIEDFIYKNNIKIV